MRFECSFCGANITINEKEFAMWSQGQKVHCQKCEEKFEKNINQTIKC